MTSILAWRRTGEKKRVCKTYFLLRCVFSCMATSASESVHSKPQLLEGWSLKGFRERVHICQEGKMSGFDAEHSWESLVRWTVAAGVRIGLSQVHWPREMYLFHLLPGWISERKSEQDKTCFTQPELTWISSKINRDWRLSNKYLVPWQIHSQKPPKPQQCVSILFEFRANKTQWWLPAFS